VIDDHERNSTATLNSLKQIHPASDRSVAFHWSALDMLPQKHYCLPQNL